MRHAARCAVAVFAMVLAVGRGAGTENHAPVSRRTPIVEAVLKTRHSIVSVKVPRQSAKDMIGTGVVIDERGYIVTNRHVVGPAKTLTIRLFDGTDLQGQVIVADTSVDLAVVKVDAGRKLPALPLAPVSDLMVGETVIAVGHPYGYSNTVSTGIVSALEREIRMPTGDVLKNLIQTDASINPGNSGGPLLNINGELIGINVALRDGAQCIAFAINAGTVKQVLSKYLSAQRVAGVHHGIACQEQVVAETGERQRVIVADHAPEAEVQKGDEILAVGDRSITNAFDLERALWDKRPGQKVDLKVVRGGQTVTVALILQRGADAGVARAGNRPGPEADTGLRGVADKNR